MISLTLMPLLLLAPCQESIPNLNNLPALAMIPAMEEGVPSPGKRVRQQWPEETSTDIHHALYLPKGPKPKKGFPVLVEFPGNGGYQNKLGDRSDGTVAGCALGFGISLHSDALWISLPFVDKAHKKNALNWWGDPEATVEYTIRTVQRVCKNHGGDPNRVFLAGFSRGSIACSYIGLRDDRISGLWKGFICHSHFDGVRKWNYADGDEKSALGRLSRLQGRPMFISHEGTTLETRGFLEKNRVNGDFTFVNLPFPNHSPGWVIRDMKETEQLRQWWKKWSTE